MTGKTHMAVGVGAAALILPTNDIKTIIGGSALALIGSLIVDIDTEKSDGSRILKDALIGIIILAALGVILKEKYNINILNFITGNRTINQLFPALVILTVILIIGKLSAHRTFTHSIVGIIAFTIPVNMLLGSITLYKWFLVGYASHILIDILNKKEVKILYPMKKGICLKICKSSGEADRALFIVFIGMAIAKYATVLM